MLWLHNTAVMLRLHPIHRFPFRLLLLLLASLLFPLSSSQPDTASSDSYYQRCKEPHPFRCGTKEYSISYPFTADGVTEGCGRPDYALKCSGDGKDGNLTIRILDEDFKVLNISYHDGGGFLTVVEQDIQVDQSTCTVKHQDAATSINTTLFEFMPQDSNLTLFTCPPSTRPPTWSFPSYSPKSCGASNPPVWYLVLSTPMQGDFLSVIPGCDETTVVVKPPPGPDAARILSDPRSLQDALQQGFDVRWRAGSDWCAGCLRTGGICGYDTNNPDEQTCYCPDGTTKGDGSCKDGKGGLSLLIKISIGFAGSFFVVACVLISFLCKYSTRFGNLIGHIDEDQTVEAFLEMHGSLALIRYRFSTIKKITSTFIEKLGEGGYGSVFKGKLDNGRIVAVKILNDIKGTGEEFINEVASIGRTNHVNIVSLLGFCSEGSKRALVYEYMPNGSLEKYLFHKNLNITPLGWEQLYKIALGIAKGLQYLHSGCKTRIVHFDIKPHNILLDEDLCPKISDFGLAKFCPPKESVLSMVCARGTIGYIAPEVFSRSFGVVTSKADVYSYGMMVLEMVGGRKNSDGQVDNSSEIYFPHWIYEHLDKVNDLKVGGITNEMEEVAKKMVLVGLWCIQANPSYRPSISRVVEMLEGRVEDLQMPPKQHLCSPPRLHSSTLETNSFS